MCVMSITVAKLLCSFGARVGIHPRLYVTRYSSAEVGTRVGTGHIIYQTLLSNTTFNYDKILPDLQSSLESNPRANPPAFYIHVCKNVSMFVPRDVVPNLFTT